MRALCIVFLVLAGIYFAPAIIAGLFGVVVSVGVLLLIAAIVYGIAFVVLGSVFMAGLVALGVIAFATLGAWLPIVLACLLIIWLVKRTITA
ncbi:hypothetical protein [Aliidiomarina quisquiliarum]|uniref:hypothetical protein n=1 Tax=Aliidiomarina quisquiliarum TaxID=2938947 RepID=UPI00208E0A2A|nr:hypothetical protein [Aliidiomarina quisquiliarum]MCO4322592.1 hypothetical protein [Aliidiomarina quisquiliarum]